jgi:hypothetical protein
MRHGGHCRNYLARTIIFSDSLKNWTRRQRWFGQLDFVQTGVAATFTPYVTRSILWGDGLATGWAHSDGAVGTLILSDLVHSSEKGKISLEFDTSQPFDGKIQTLVNRLIQQDVSLNSIRPSTRRQKFFHTRRHKTIQNRTRYQYNWKKFKCDQHIWAQRGIISIPLYLVRLTSEECKCKVDHYIHS